MTRLLNYMLRIACAVAVVEGAPLSVEWKTEKPPLRFTPHSGIGFRLSPLNDLASSFTELDGNSNKTRSDASQAPSLGMACSDALVSTATVASSSCAKDNGVCTSGPLESVMDGLYDHAWRPENVTTLDFLEYTWPNPVIIRYVQTSGLATDAAVTPPCQGQCGAPKLYRVQFQDSASQWQYYKSFKDANAGKSYSELDGEARPPDSRMQAITPPVETKHMRLRFETWVGDKVAARASIRGCLASETAAGDMSLNAPYNSIFPAVYADVKTFANVLKGYISHETAIHCTADQVAVQSIGASEGSTFLTGSTTVRIIFLPKGGQTSNEEPSACVTALGTVVGDSSTELAKWAADVLTHAHPLTVATCADVNCGKHGACAAGQCFCHSGFQGSDCSVEIGTSGYANTEDVTEGNSNVGLASPQLLGVTSNSLSLQYTNSGTPPSEDQLNAEMEQIAEDLRNDNEYDEKGYSGKALRHGTAILGLAVVAALGLLVTVLVLAKGAPSKKKEDKGDKKKDDKKDEKRGSSLPRASVPASGQ